MISLIISIIAAGTAVLVSFAVIFKRHHLRLNAAFSIALLSTAVVIMGDAMSIFKPGSLFQWKRAVSVAESVMAPSWLLFALSFARNSFGGTINILSKTLVLGSPLLILFCLIVPIDYFYYIHEVGKAKVLYLNYAGYTFKLIVLFYSFMSIVNIEATLRCASSTERVKIKETLIGVGGIVAINIFYYSHALLYRYIDMNLVSVKAGIILISVLFIAYSLLKNSVIDVQVVVSRRVVYRSISVFVIAVYLIGVGIMGNGMMYVDPQVGKNITVFLAFAGMIAILAVILSEQLRRKAFVLINKNFYRNKYDYREQWLRFTQRISLKHSYDGLLSAIAEGFKDAIGLKSVAIWLDDRGNGEYVCVKSVETDETSIGPNKELINFLKDKQWILYIRDPKCNDTVLKSAEFIEGNNVCLIVPLMHRDKLVGFIVLGEALANVEYNYEDYDLLKTLARQATAAILNAKLSEELIEAKEMEAIGKLSSFVIHDLKNAASMLNMLAQNAEEHIDNPDFQKDAIHGITNTSEKINGITMKLKNFHQKTKVNLEYHDLGICVQSAVSEFSLNGDDRLKYVEKETVETKFDREEIHKVVVNLIMNALDATGHKGYIKVVVGKENNIPYIKVSDNGCGMSRVFLERDLFKPFHTSKKKGLGIGLYQCKTIVEDHSGKIRVNSVEGEGTDITIYLPSYII